MGDLFGLTPDGHKETKETYSFSKPELAYDAEDHAASSGDGPAAPVTIASVRLGMSDQDRLENHGSSTVGDSKIDGATVSAEVAVWAVSVGAAGAAVSAGVAVSVGAAASAMISSPVA